MVLAARLETRVTFRPPDALSHRGEPHVSP